MTEQEEQKQIEELAKALSVARTDVLHSCIGYCQLCDSKYKSCGMHECLVLTEAEHLFNAGWRDTKQAVREFAEKLKKQATPLGRIWIEQIDELVKEICGK